MTRARPILRLLAGLLVAGLAAACVGEVAVEGAPCPCPDGYRCCASLGETCLPDDRVCPARLPASSTDPCRRDVECPRGERCHAWTLADGSHAGPGECRRTCDGDPPCAEGERCAPALHDGAALDATSATLACLPDPPPAVCADLACDRCGLDGIGRTACAADGVRGCFLGVHPACGLVCHDVLVTACPGAACRETETGARCDVFGDDACADFPCAGCGPAAAPGEVRCDDGEVALCATLPAPPALCGGVCACDRLCERLVVEVCPGGCAPEGDRCAR